MANTTTGATSSSSMAAIGWMYAIGSLAQAVSLREQGKMAKIQMEERRAAAEFAAWQAEQQAAVAVAIGQRNAIEAGRQTRVLESRALALMAAGGGGASDPTSVRLMADLEAQGAYRKGVALYEGEAQARSLRYQAVVGRTQPFEEGKQAAYNMAASGELLKGSATLYARYGMKGPNATPAGSGDAALIGDFPGSDGDTRQI